MSRTSKRGKGRALVPAAPAVSFQPDFDEVVGEYISGKIAAERWGAGTVQALADYIQRRQPGTTGFSASNLWRMRQFYETYRDTPKLAPLLRELS